VEIKNILIDTNAYTAFKCGKQDAVEVIRHVPLIGFSCIVLGELLGGFAFGKLENVNISELNRFLNSGRVSLFFTDNNTARFYAKVYRNLRLKGRPVPTNDMWIAATALQHNLAVFTYDKHFDHIEGINTGNCLSDFT